MWKYNKYTLGDKVKHEENRSIEFEVVDILSAEPEKKGGYLYTCKVIKHDGSKIPQGWATAEEVAVDITYPDRPLFERIFKYAENKLRLIRKATIDELSEILKVVIKKEDYERASWLKDEIDKLKNFKK